MTKNEKRIILVDAIVLALFLVIAFVIDFRRNAVFWISLLFGVLAIGIQPYVINYAFKKGDDIRSKFYGFPIAKIGTGYMAVQVMVSIVFMIVVKFFDTPLWIPIVAYVLILGISAIGFIAADATRDEVENIDRKLVVDTECMQQLRLLVSTLSSQVDAGETKIILEKLSEDFRYSDPVSCDATKVIEGELVALVSEVQKSVMNAENDMIKELCKKISVVLTERNSICKLNKRK